MTNAIGTIISGTLRREDLIPAFQKALSDILATETAVDDGHHELVSECDDIINRDAWAEERAGEIVGDLIEALNCYAPPYCTFGAHEGDGSDYGFWPEIDRLEEDAVPVNEFGIGIHEVMKVNDLGHADAALTENASAPLVMVVNDHGNVTLYRVVPRFDYEEVWAAV